MSDKQLTLTPEDNHRLANLCGHFDSHLQQLEKHFQISIQHRGHHFNLQGDNAERLSRATHILLELYQMTLEQQIMPEKIHLLAQASQAQDTDSNDKPAKDIWKQLSLRTKQGIIKGRTPNQSRYIDRILRHDINFGIGPAGTGKTYIAVASAVEYLETEKVQRIILIRPAVEAGERLGFLPGDLSQKVDPYLRPLYDALYEMLGFDKVTKLIERGIIEVAPLAYMRGRTLNESFIILDEAQNTTVEQMKMFLTRIGFGSTAVITGDITQIDLPKQQRSGLKQVAGILNRVKGISFTHLESKDVVRHPLVQSIIEAYARAEKAEASRNNESQN